MPVNRHPCLIAVVEDSFEIRRAMCELLELEGFETRGFSNGIDALTTLSLETGPCLILLDWIMPVMSGEEFLRVRSSFPNAAAAAPVLLVSAFAGEAPNLIGVNGVMKKPIHHSALVDAVRVHSKIECDRLLQPA